MISILMGVYNCASTVEEAVQSIIDQTITDWELIICDDGSADNTYEVVKALAEKEKRIGGVVPRIIIRVPPLIKLRMKKCVNI